jgi:hypothetical protein
MRKKSRGNRLLQFMKGHNWVNSRSCITKLKWPSCNYPRQAKYYAPGKKNWVIILSPFCPSVWAHIFYTFYPILMLLKTNIHWNKGFWNKASRSFKRVLGHRHSGTEASLRALLENPNSTFLRIWSLFICLFITTRSRLRGAMLERRAQWSDDPCVGGSNPTVGHGCRSFGWNRINRGPVSQ